VTPIEIMARVATTDDLPRLCLLEAEARDIVRPVRGGAVHLDVDGVAWTLSSRFGSPDAVVFAGLIDDAVIGYAVVSSAAAAARIEAIYVEQEARELGVGEELLNQAIAWARDRMCTTLDAVALPGDRHTKNFFETFGMVARAITVSRSL
jgi:GNAT superfamily N-acetyltransferase